VKSIEQNAICRKENLIIDAANHVPQYLAAIADLPEHS
jgi:hypothetical protein